MKNKKANSRLDNGDNITICPSSKRSNSRLNFVLNKSLPKSKRSQHEIAGFVLIVLVVTIIGVGFLSFVLLKTSPKYNNAEVSNLLEATMYSTTDCAVSYVPEYKDINALIKDAYSNPGKKCKNGKSVSQTLRTDLKQILDKSLDIHEQGVNRAYKLDIYYTEKDIPDFHILNFSKGIFKNCSSVIGGWKTIPKDSGDINVELEVCKGGER
jgi:hypothetical protein